MNSETQDGQVDDALHIRCAVLFRFLSNMGRQAAVHTVCGATALAAFWSLVFEADVSFPVSNVRKAVPNLGSAPSAGFILSVSGFFIKSFQLRNTQNLFIR